MGLIWQTVYMGVGLRDFYGSYLFWLSGCLAVWWRRQDWGYPDQSCLGQVGGMFMYGIGLYDSLGLGNVVVVWVR